MPRLKFLYLYDGVLREHTEDYIRLATPYPYFDWKSLKFLGLECNWLDIDRDRRGRPVVTKWPTRVTLWNPFEAPERLGEDGEVDPEERQVDYNGNDYETDRPGCEMTPERFLKILYLEVSHKEQS